VNILVTGCAGFIGSTLVDRFLADGHSVVGIDDFSTGQRQFVRDALELPTFRLVEGDLLDAAVLDRAMPEADLVVHLAANADVRFGPDHPKKDLEQNTVVTFEVLDAMRRHGVKRIAFASTGSVYGEPAVFPTPEDAPFPQQTSLYGASKLACEALIQAFAESFGFQGYIFRFVSILGERYTHGHVVDFVRALHEHPDWLHVLGNGRQRKSYLYVQDCIDAILHALTHATGRVNIFNLGTDEFCQVNDSIGWITEALGVTPRLSYEGGERGWIGDNPFIFLDCSRIRSLGWTPRLTIREGVIRTVRYLQENDWVLQARA
jgi:UDP-glucose 4-epimerase